MLWKVCVVVGGWGWGDFLLDKFATSFCKLPFCASFKPNVKDSKLIEVSSVIFGDYLNLYFLSKR